MSTLALVLQKQGRHEEAVRLISDAESMVLSKEAESGKNAKRVLAAKKEILKEPAAP